MANVALRGAARRTDCSFNGSKAGAARVCSRGARPRCRRCPAAVRVRSGRVGPRGAAGSAPLPPSRGMCLCAGPGWGCVCVVRKRRDPAPRAGAARRGLRGSCAHPPVHPLTHTPAVSHWARGGGKCLDLTRNWCVLWCNC